MKFMEDEIIKIIDESKKQSKNDIDLLNDLVFDKLASVFNPADLGNAMIIASKKINDDSYNK